MSKTTAEIQAILTAGVPLTTAEALEAYQLARDQLVIKMVDSGAPVTVVIRGRTAEFSNPAETLEILEKLIRHYESIIARQGGGLAHTLARVNR